MIVQARRGKAWRGAARRGEARHGPTHKEGTRMAGPPRMKNYVPNPPWPKARAERLAVDDYCCQASTFGVMTVCDYRPTGLAEVHHRLPRGRGGRNDLDNLVTLCPGHHRWVETERAAAKERGLLL